jgi:transposase InsO family protein
MNRKYTKQSVNEAVVFLSKGQLPPRLCGAESRARFRRRWDSFSVVMSDDQQLLFHGGRQVVPLEDVSRIVSEAYRNPATTGGRDRMWKRLSTKYIGISRRNVMNVLRNEEVWQLLKQPNGPKAQQNVRQPILAKQPLQRIQIDLIDMSRFAGSNSGKHWALTAIDIFTKKGYAIPLADKTSARVSAAFEEHILEGGVPTVVMSDNGTEFRNHDFKELERRHGFKQVFSSSYSPSSNGCVERFNKTLKMLIRHHFVSKQTKNWINVLPLLLANYNSAIHSTTKFTPDELEEAWENETREGNNKLDQARVNLIKRAKHSLGAEPKETVCVGDNVRILSSRRKKPMKTSEIKLRRPTWTEKVWEVEQVSMPKVADLSLPRYTLVGSTERFYASELQKIDTRHLVARPEPRPRVRHQRHVLTTIPVASLQERKRGERSVRRPRRYRNDDQ